MSVLYADIALVFCIFATFQLRAFIIGERFDRALHRVDPDYRNLRDMTQRTLVEPVAGLRGLPKAYGRWYGVTFRPVDDPEVERLRRRAVRGWVESVVFGLGAMAAAGVVGALLRRISVDLDRMAVLLTLALMGLYWLRRLVLELRSSDSSAMASLYMLGGVAAALAAFVFVVSFPSRLA